MPDQVRHNNNALAVLFTALLLNVAIHSKCFFEWCFLSGGNQDGFCGFDCVDELEVLFVGEEGGFFQTFSKSVYILGSWTFNSPRTKGYMSFVPKKASVVSAKYSLALFIA